MTNSGVVISTMFPSGAARAAASVPITVPAPGRFSITIVGPCARAICSASSRPRISEPPPGVEETMILMVRVACGPAAWPDKASRTMAQPAASDRLAIIIRRPTPAQIDLVKGEPASFPRPPQDGGSRAGSRHLAQPVRPPAGLRGDPEQIRRMTYVALREHADI